MARWCGSMAEHLTRNEKVVSSILTTSSIFIPKNRYTESVAFMNEKDLKRLGRQELVDMIVKLQNEALGLRTLNNTLSSENARLSKELEEEKAQAAKYDIDNIGSLANAVADMTGIIAKAQETADTYVAEVKKMRDEAEESSKKMLDEANASARDIVAKANIDSDCIKANAKAEADVQWQQFNTKVNDILQAHAELSALLGKR